MTHLATPVRTTHPATVVTPAAEPLAEPLAVVADYETAFAHYQQRDFGTAMALLEAHPDDPPSRVLLSRCRRYLDHPPLAEWDGSFLFTSK